MDYRDPDGAFRKYRIVLIGTPFAVHMGISAHWMIHYLNAGMTDSAEKRAEEERWMFGFDEDFRAAACGSPRGHLQGHRPDFLIIDCGEAPMGSCWSSRSMPAIIHAMDPVDIFPLAKQPQMRKLFDGFRALLLDVAEQGGLSR